MHGVKTHTFRFGKYTIDEAPGLYGCCDVPGMDHDLGMTLLSGSTCKALIIAIHEAMHAEGVPDRYVHDLTPDRIGRFLWRLGYRKLKS